MEGGQEEVRGRGGGSAGGRVLCPRPLVSAPSQMLWAERRPLSGPELARPPPQPGCVIPSAPQPLQDSGAASP